MEDCLPRLFFDSFYVLLEDRLAGILSHIETGEAAEGIGVFQMKGQFLIGELAVLLQYCTPEDLFCGQSLSAGIGSG